MKSSYSDFLAQLRPSKDLPEVLIQEVLGVAKVKSFAKGEIIFRMGEPAEWMGLILSGSVREFVGKGGGTEQVFLLQREGEFCGPAPSFLDGRPASCNTQALEFTEILTISREEFIYFCEKYPEAHLVVYQSLFRLTADRLAEKNRLLGMTAVERYQFFLRKHPELMARIPLGQISSFLGIRQSSLSRIRRQLSMGAVR